MMSRFIVLGMVLLGLSLSGCDMVSKENRDVAKNSASRSDTEKDASEASESAEEAKSYMQQAKEMLDQAAQAGQTTAANAGQWLSDSVSGAISGTGKAVEDTGEWITQTYESLHEQGMTSASNVSQWVQDDIQNIYAWEYRVVTKSPEFFENAEETLNELGRERWECFETDDQALYFKRQKKSYLRNVPVKDLLRFMPGAESE